MLEKSSSLVNFIPLAQKNLSSYSETHSDSSNHFIYSRFLTPFLMHYSGWAIFADGAMVCNHDITELWNLRDQTKAVQVVKHDYKIKKTVKYLCNKKMKITQEKIVLVLFYGIVDILPIRSLRLHLFKTSLDPFYTAFHD